MRKLAWGFSGRTSYHELAKTRTLSLILRVHRICDLEKSFSAGDAHNMIDCQSNDRRVPFSYFSKKAQIHSAFSENVTQFHILKDIEIWAIILVPLIMTLSRGHTGQIKGTVIMKWLWLLYRGNKIVPWRDQVIYDKILIFILVKEIVLYTDKSPLEAPLILWEIETVPCQLILYSNALANATRRLIG